MLKPIKWYTSLADSKVRRHEGVFLVEGHRSIEQIALVDRKQIVEILCLKENAAQFPDISHRIITAAQRDSIAQSQTPQGVLAVVRIPDGCYGSELPLQTGNRIVVLEDVQDPGNVGTLIRTAAALGFDGVLLTDKCSDPLSPKAAQASAGTLFSLWWRKTAIALDLIDQLIARDFLLYVTVADKGTDIALEKIPKKILLALGNEAHGVSPQMLSRAYIRCTIPINSAYAESLNVAVAGGIAMFLCGKRKL